MLMMRGVVECFPLFGFCIAAEKKEKIPKRRCARSFQDMLNTATKRGKELVGTFYRYMNVSTADELPTPTSVTRIANVIADHRRRAPSNLRE
jgi:hypothetical protein